MKEGGSGLSITIDSLSLCRPLLRTGLVDRFRVYVVGDKGLEPLTPCASCRCSSQLS